MSYLYVDTSDHIVLGLFSKEKGSWIDYLELEESKSSGKLHGLMENMLSKAQIHPRELSGFIQVSGPGSYTGVRLSEGIAQIFEWQEIPSYSFYHFEVPRALGEKKGIWISKAFKGEFFVFSWNQDLDEKKLCSRAELEILLSENSKINTHFSVRFSNDFPDFYNNFTETGILIKDYPQRVLEFFLAKKARVLPYYYRALDQEFHCSSE